MHFDTSQAQANYNLLTLSTKVFVATLVWSLKVLVLDRRLVMSTNNSLRALARGEHAYRKHLKARRDRDTSSDVSCLIFDQWERNFGISWPITGLEKDTESSLYILDAGLPENSDPCKTKGWTFSKLEYLSRTQVRAWQFIYSILRTCNWRTVHDSWVHVLFYSTKTCRL